MWDILATEYGLLEENFGQMIQWWEDYKKRATLFHKGLEKSLFCKDLVKSEVKSEEGEMEACGQRMASMEITSSPFKIESLSRSSSLRSLSPTWATIGSSLSSARSLSPDWAQLNDELEMELAELTKQGAQELHEGLMFNSCTPSPVPQFKARSPSPRQPSTWAAIAAKSTLAPLPPSPPSTKIVLKNPPPQGLATIRMVCSNYGLLDLHLGGTVLVFTKESLLDGGSLLVEDLSMIFHCGDICFVEGASRFVSCNVGSDVHHQVRRMTWLRDGNSGSSVAVSHGLMLSRFPESVIGIHHFLQIDAPASAFSVDPYQIAICASVLVRYRGEALADHGLEAIAVAPLGPIRYEEELVFVARSGQAMIAVAGSGDVVFVPKNVLQFRHFRATDELLGDRMGGLTCPILPYENPGAPLGTTLQAPRRRVHLLYP